MKTEEKAVELLPCPFCGGRAEIGAKFIGDSEPAIWCVNPACGNCNRCFRVKDWNARAPVSQWIRVEDRLPEKRENEFGPRSDYVLVWAPGWDTPVQKGRFFFLIGEWRIEGQNGKQTVTHWMELPPKPSSPHTFQIVMPGSDKPIEAK